MEEDLEMLKELIKRNRTMKAIIKEQEYRIEILEQEINKLQKLLEEI